MTKHGTDWRFEDPENVAVFTTDDIIEGRKPILYVSHDADDGSWQFHSGEIANVARAKTVALREIVRLDPTITELADLPEGWIAERAHANSEWRRYTIS